MGGYREEALERSRREGVDPPENLPFWMEPPGPPRAAVLLVHGFTASPWEMRAFGAALAAAGFLAHGVRLPGHGTSPEDLARRTYEEWLAEVEAGYRSLAEAGLPVCGLGLSTGALLLVAAAERCPWQALGLLSPYLRLRHRLAPAVGLLRFFRHFQSHDRSLDLAPFYYDRRPLEGIYQLLRLIRRARKVLPEVGAPSLVIASQGDRTTRPASAQELFRLLGSGHREFHLFGPEVPHILTTAENPRQARVLQLVLDFFHAGSAGPRDQADSFL